MKTIKGDDDEIPGVYVFIRDGLKQWRLARQRERKGVSTRGTILTNSPTLRGRIKDAIRWQRVRG